MNKKRIFLLLLLFCLAIAERMYIGQLHPLTVSEEIDASLETFRNFALPQDAAVSLKEEQLLAYLFCQTNDKSVLDGWIAQERTAAPKDYASYLSMLQALLADAKVFPVAELLSDAAADISYGDSWNDARTYGGNRRHEGTDIMAGVQKRGYYPVLSVSDGVVEKMGWLPQGGYRIGIRSMHGVYYYYAHLSEYAGGLKENMPVSAGQLLGFMGDTGYSSVEGTTGNFPVHLHFGMYLNLEDGTEMSFNPYHLLCRLEKNKIKS